MLECHVVVARSACYWTVITQPMELINTYTLHKMAAVSVKAICFGSFNMIVFEPVYVNITAADTVYKL
jgi:hypothetical protein